jgi:UDP:flavonoid glycosyltransferase YjiC (YdhE family)
VLDAGPPIDTQIAETVRRVGVRWTAPGPEAAELFAGTRVDLTWDAAEQQVRRFRPDLLVCDPLDFVGPTVAASMGLPWATHGISGGLPPAFMSALTQRWHQQLAARRLAPTIRLAYLDPYPDALHGNEAVHPSDRLPVRVEPFDRPGSQFTPPVFQNAAPRVLLSLGTSLEDNSLEPDLTRNLATAGYNVLVTRSAPAGVQRTSNIRYLGFVPLARVLPEVSAVISAGGTGTLLSALAAGLPLVIRPVMADQPLNATRAEHLGVSRTLRTSTDVARLIGEVLDDPRYREAAERVRRANAALPSPGAVLSDLLSRLS